MRAIKGIYSGKEFVGNIVISDFDGCAHVRRGIGGRHPIMHGMRASTVEAAGGLILGTAVRTRCARREGVEGLAAFSTFPVIANGRRVVARGAGESLATRKLREARKGLRLFEATPTTHRQVDRNDAEPCISDTNREHDESGDAEKSDDSSGHEAAGASEDEPQQRTEDLAAVERVDGKDIEKEKAAVDPEY